MCGYFSIRFIDFVLKGRSSLEYTNLFLSNYNEKNGKIILNIFIKILRWKKIYCVTCGKYKKFKNPKTSYILRKTLVDSIICRKCGSKDEKYSAPKHMTGENISQEFRSKGIDKTRNYFIKEIKQNELISKKHKKICKILKYTEYLLILDSTVNKRVSISALASLVGILVGATSSAIAIKIAVITAGIKKHKSRIKVKRKKLDKIVLLAKPKLNTIEVSISKALIDSNISHHKFVSINNVLKEYDDMKEEIKHSNE